MTAGDPFDRGPGAPDDGVWDDDEPTPPAERGRAIRAGVLTALLAIGALAVVGTTGEMRSPEASSTSPKPTFSATVVATLTPGTASPSRLPTHAPSDRATAGPSRNPAQPSFVPIISVTDGDTIRVVLDGVSEPVRIIGLDSPESRQPGTPVECMATEATAAAERLLRDGVVALEEDPTQDMRDRYGRVLAHVFLEDGRLFSEEMIRSGFAIHYVYDGIESVYADRLALAERQAIEAERGLWDPATCDGDPHAPSSVP